MNWDIYFLCVTIVFGLLIGSFLNVCIFRIPSKESIAKGSSHCTTCGTKIKRYDLIPVFSYVFLGGKCRHCKAKISPRYPIIESLNCLLYILIYLTCGLQLKTLLYFALASTMIVVTMIDLDTMEIPNGLIIFLLCLSPLAFFVNDMPFWERLIGFFAASLILLLLAIFTNGFGGGDIKLMAACGLLLGYKNILLALFIGVVVGGIVGGILLLTSKKPAKGRMMPFGPSLCFGVLTAALYGETILNWYITLLH